MKTLLCVVGLVIALMGCQPTSYNWTDKEWAEYNRGLIPKN